jgi:hypothetical protein
MNRRRLVAALAFALCAGTGGAQQPPADVAVAAADWTEIRRAVTEQREAIAAADEARAYAHAAPGLRARYPTPAAFMAMIRRAYAPLVDARLAQPLDGAVIGGDVIQPLQLVMPDGTVLVALYTMEKQPDGRWRIAGCLLAPSVRKSA